MHCAAGGELKRQQGFSDGFDEQPGGAVVFFGVSGDE